MNEDALARSGGGTSTGAEGKSDDQRTASTERPKGISTRGGEEVENPSTEDALGDSSLRFIMSRKDCGVESLGTTKSGRILEIVTRPACGALEGGTIEPEGVEIVSIVDVGGDGPLRGVRPNGGSGGMAAGEGVRLSLIGESWVWRKEPTTDSTDGV
jgi:hypothetical protein